MITLANEFEQLVRSSRLHTERHLNENGISIHVFGSNGTAEVDFMKDEIVGLIDSEFLHGWRGFPTDKDARASAKKVCSILE